jgi:hypothetical protein
VWTDEGRYAVKNAFFRPPKTCFEFVLSREADEPRRGVITAGRGTAK